MKLFLIAGALLVTAAFGLPATPAAAATQKPVATAVAAGSPSATVLWMDVPFVQQTKDGCGSAVIAMVIRYWDRKEGRSAGPTADPEKIQAALFSPKAGGIYASRMRQYLESAGYRTFAFHGRWGDLLDQVRKGRPLIVALGMDGLDGPLHYVVVVGVDSERQYVLVNDPAQQKMLRMSKKGFESEWSRTDHWTLLAVPQTRH